MPREARDPDMLFDQANRAFQAGEVATAQNLLGEIAITAPNYGGGVVTQALSDTCSRLGQDCELVMTRLEFISDAWFGRHEGPRGGWHPQQEEAYLRIVACYDHLIVGDFDEALRSGGPVTGAPLPAYAQAATRCVQRAQTVVSERERQQRADAALSEWHANYPCMDAYRRDLLDAYSIEDWERFVEVYPQFEACARPLDAIIRDGALEGDPRLGLQHDLAFTHLSEVELILEDHAETITTTRRGVASVESNPTYVGHLRELATLDTQIAEIEGRLRSLRQAADAVTGPEAEPIRNSIASTEQGRDALANRRQQVVDAANAIRISAGLPARDDF
ncbi:MAG: hypothetical protein EA398_15010 [Deltaproteobacteria bacterium]|nr:MAG: hypothetical protein EA398_15010 [Deltaproteobacteria bacterium]